MAIKKFKNEIDLEISNINGLHITPKSMISKCYFVEVSAPQLHNRTYSGITYSNEPFSLNAQFFVNIHYPVEWLIRTYEFDRDKYKKIRLVHEHQMSFKNKTIVFDFATQALGDTYVWVGVIDRWIKKHNPQRVYMRTFWNDSQNHRRRTLNTDRYSDKIVWLDNIDPHKPPQCDFYLRYGISRLHEKLGFNSSMFNHATLTSWQEVDMVSTHALTLDVGLGVDRPHLTKLPEERIIPNKYVTICFGPSQKIKSWLNYKGMYDLVKYLRKLGYHVVGVGNSHNFVPEIQDIVADDIQLSMRLIRDAEFHVGLSSGHSWTAFSYNKDVLMIGNFTDPGYEFIEKNTRVINSYYPMGIFNNPEIPWQPVSNFDAGDKTFRCCEGISGDAVIMGVNELLRKKERGIEQGTYYDENTNLVRPIVPLLPNKPWLSDRLKNKIQTYYDKYDVPLIV